MSALPENGGMPGGWNDSDWNSILYAISEKECTPFLGAGAAAGILPLGGELAADWAREYGYPFGRDRRNLIRVAQYVAVEQGDEVLRRQIRSKFAWRPRGKYLHDRVWPIFSNTNEPHTVLASLDLPIYITTNYDTYMYRALKYLNKKPRLEICQWYKTKRETGKQVVGDVAPRREPTPQRPLVYHLHGHFSKPASMVLTEDDYIDFLINVSKNEEAAIPTNIRAAFRNTDFLFVGYSLEDISFRFLFRKLAEDMRGRKTIRHVSVQLQPRQYETPDSVRRRAQRQLSYLQEHFKTREVKVFWGRADEFTRELRRRWKAFPR